MACWPNSASASCSSLSDDCTALSVWISALTLREESCSYGSGGGPAFSFASASAARFRCDARNHRKPTTPTARISTSHNQARLPEDEPAVELPPLADPPEETALPIASADATMAPDQSPAPIADVALALICALTSDLLSGKASVT